MRGIITGIQVEFEKKEQKLVQIMGDAPESRMGCSLQDANNF